MRETNEQIKITMNFPYDKPDANGVVYSKEAVKRAIDICNNVIKEASNEVRWSST